MNLISRFQAHRSGHGYRCPAHDDQHASLSITETNDKWLLKCHRGCSIEAICAGLGIQQRDLFKDKPKEIAHYDYNDENDQLLFQAVRYEPKTFKQRRPDGHGGWIRNLNDVRRVLYRLPEVLAASDVIICEGEKDVETARSWDLVATCNPMGAGKWQEEYGESLRGKHVTIITDADEPGRKHAQQVAQSVHGKATSVKVIELPGAKDLSEWVERGGKREELLKLIQDAPEWKEQQLPWRQMFKTRLQMEQGKIQFLIEEFLPEGITLIGALAGVGKTWFALSMAKALTTGSRFLGHFNVPVVVPVLYMIPESGERAFRSRMDKMQIPDENFFVRTMNDGLPLKLDDPLLLAAVRELKPVVVLDSAIRFNEAESENDALQNAHSLANGIFGLRYAGARAVIGLHHSPKSSAGQEMTLENILRGTGEIGALPDTAYGLQCINPETVELLVKCIKPRDFEPVRPFHIQARNFINEMGDFGLLVKPDLPPESAEAVKLAEAIAGNPALSYRELEDKTGIPINRIAKVASKAGWQKQGSRWVDTTHSLVN